MIGKSISQRDASATALGVAALRAAHLILDDPPPVLNDHVAIRLLDAATEGAIRDHAGRFRTPGSLALRSHVLLRNRFAEDQLAGRVGMGTRQYVLLGAGLDTFAYRQPAWAADVAIFEVDHPASQRTKRERLARAGITLPPNARLVPVDLASGDAPALLAAAGFDRAAPAVVSCLGVLPYLDAGTVARVFGFVAGLAGGSAFVLTFAPPARPGAPDELAARVAMVGEPFLTRQTSDELASSLGAAGLSDVAFLSAEDAQRYFAGRRDGLHASDRVSIARAIVA